MEVISIIKTYVLGTDGVTFFEVVTTTYDDESQDVTKRRIGGAAELAGDQADKIEATMRGQLNAAYQIALTKRLIQEATAVDADINTLSGASPFKKIQDRYGAIMVKSGWTIDDGAGFVPMVFTINAQGVLRYAVNGGATKTAKIFGSILRPNNYPSAPTETDFYLTENGNRYFSLPNKAVQIKLP